MPSAPMSRARLTRPTFNSAMRTRATVSLRTVARRCSATSFQSRWPCSASITTKSMPRATAISVMAGESSVTQSPNAGRPAVKVARSARQADGFMDGALCRGQDFKHFYGGLLAGVNYAKPAIRVRAGSCTEPVGHGRVQLHFQERGRFDAAKHVVLD